MKECFVYLLDSVHSSPWLDSIGECCLLLSVRDEHVFFFKQHLLKVEQWLIHLSRDVMVYFYQGQIYFGLMFKKTKNSCIHFQRFYTKHIENGDDTTPIFAPQWLAKACHRWSNEEGCNVQLVPVLTESPRFSHGWRCRFLFLVCGLVLQQSRQKNRRKV